MLDLPAVHAVHDASLVAVATSPGSQAWHDVRLVAACPWYISRRGPIFVPDWCSKLVLRGALFPSKSQQERGALFPSKILYGAFGIGPKAREITSASE